MKNKVLSILLCLVMVISLLPTVALAAATSADTLAAALNAAYTAGSNEGDCCTVSGNTVILRANVTLTDTIEITSGTLILNLGGNIIYGADDKTPFSVSGDAAFEVKNGNLLAKGNNTAGLTVAGGEVRLQDMNISGSENCADGGIGLAVSDGIVTAIDSNFRGGSGNSTAGGTGISVTGGDVTIRGGQIYGGNGLNSVSGGNGITMSDGSIYVQGDCYIGGGSSNGNGGHGLSVTEGTAELQSCILTGGNHDGTGTGAAGKAISAGRVLADFIDAGYAAYDDNNAQISSTDLVGMPYISVHKQLAEAVWVDGVWLSSEAPYWKNGDTTASNTAEDYNAYFDAATGTLTLKDAVVTGVEADGDNVGIYAEDCLTVTLEGRSTVIGGTAADGQSFGVYNDKILTINGSGTLTALGGAAEYSFGVYAEIALEVFGDAAVTAAGGQASGVSSGLGCGGDSITISGAKVTAVGEHIGVNGDIIFNGGLLAAKGGTKALSNAATGSGVSDETLLAGANSNSSKYVVFGDSDIYHVATKNVTASTTNVANHIAWSGDTLTLTDTIIIGEDSASGDAAAVTVPDDGKLNLNGFNVILAGNPTNGESYGILTGGESTLNLSGSSVVLAGTAAGQGNYSRGVYSKYSASSPYSLTIQDSGSGGFLTAIGGCSPFSSFGVSGDGNVIIKGSAAVTTIGGCVDGTTNISSYGMYANSITMNDNAALTAIGGCVSGSSQAPFTSYGLTCGTLTVNGGSGTAVGGSAANAGSGGTHVQAMYSNATITGAITTGEKTDRMMTWVSAPAPAHSHCVCGGSDDCLLGDHTSHSDITYTAIPAGFTGGALESGNYYLDRDVTLTSSVTVESDETVNLCLNGHKLSANGGDFSVITVSYGGILNICDCSTGHRYGQWNEAKTTYSITHVEPQSGDYDTLSAGMITGGNGENIGMSGGVHSNGSFNLYSGSIAGNSGLSGGGVYNNYGTFKLYSGSIAGNTSSNAGGGVVNSSTFSMYGGSITRNSAPYGGGVKNSGTFNMSEGSIAGNSATFYGGGVNNDKIFNLSGGSITGNSASVGGGIYTSKEISLSGAPNFMNGIFLDNSYGQTPKINIVGALSYTEPLAVSMYSPDVFTIGSFTLDGVTKYPSDYMDKFTGTSLGRVVVDGQQLKLQPLYQVYSSETTNGSFTVTVNGEVPTGVVPGETVTITPTPADGYVVDEITVFKSGNTSITVPVSNSNTFIMPDFYVRVTVTFKVISAPPSYGGGGDSPITPTAPVIVDGKSENIGKTETTTTETKIIVDSSKLTEKVGSAEAGGSVVVPVSDGKATATAEIVVKNVEEMAKKDMTLTVQTGNVSYNLPTAAIDTAEILSELGASDSAKVPVSVTIEKGTAVTVEGAEVIGTPTQFTVTATFGGKAVEVVLFDKFVSRVIEVTAEQAGKITTAIVKETDGSVRHVPTMVYTKEGKWYAKINSRTNSIYAFIANEVSFADASGKWYQAAVEEMAGRKIVNGTSATTFAGEASITRAEFAAILVRALGLPTDGTANFTDVKAGDWFSGAVGTAVEYGLVTGYGDGSFAPNASITRQEAMVIVQRAAKVAEYPELANAFNITEYYDDLGEVADWASGAVSWNVFNGLIKGADRLVRPTDTITRAETATVVLRLLQNSKLVDVRTKA